MSKKSLRIHLVVLLVISASAMIGILLNFHATDDNSDFALPVVLSYNDSQTTRSSAVYIGSGYFLTAAHILDDAQSQVLIETNLGQSAVVDILWNAVEYDITLLYYENYQDLEINQFPINCEPLSYGTELRFIGNPTDAEFITTWGRVSSYAITNDDNIWSRVIPVDASIIPGMSGGAAVDEQDRLRGIIVGTLRSIVGISNFGTPVPSFTGISFIVEGADICHLMGR